MASTSQSLQMHKSTVGRAGNDATNMAAALNTPGSRYDGVETVVLTALIYIYIMRISSMQYLPKDVFIRRRVRLFGTWMLKIAIFFSFLSSTCIAILSAEYKLAKHNIESLKILATPFIYHFKGRDFDITAIMTYTLKISEILFMSSVFFMIASVTRSNKPSLLPFEREGHHSTASSLASNCTFWAIFRIPLRLYFDAYRYNFTPKVTSIAFNIMSLIELLFAGCCLLVMDCKHFEADNNCPDVLAMGISIILYSVGRYAINLAEMPIWITDLHFKVITGLQSALELVIYLQMIRMYGYTSPDTTDALNKQTPEILTVQCYTKDSEPDVVLMPSLVEFENKYHL